MSATRATTLRCWRTSASVARRVAADESPPLRARVLVARTHHAAFSDAGGSGSSVGNDDEMVGSWRQYSRPQTLEADAEHTVAAGAGEGDIDFSRRERRCETTAAGDETMIVMASRFVVQQQRRTTEEETEQLPPHDPYVRPASSATDERAVTSGPPPPRFVCVRRNPAHSFWAEEKRSADARAAAAAAAAARMRLLAAARSPLVRQGPQ